MTLCSAAALSSCETVKRSAVSLRPDLEHPDWFDCKAGQTRPVIGPEYKVDWTTILAQPDKERAVQEAQRQVGVLIDTQHARELVVSNYVLGLEATNFNCANDTTTQLDFYQGLPTEPQP